MATEVVADAGTLVHLTQTDALTSLDVFDAATIPKTVIEEIGDGDVLDALKDARYIVEPVDHTGDDYQTLDPGETVVVPLTADRGSVLLTDVLAAREVADDPGIEVHGSIDVISSCETSPPQRFRSISTPAWLPSVLSRRLPAG